MASNGSGRPKKAATRRKSVEQPKYLGLPPPEGVSARVRALWLALTDEQSVDFFAPSDSPLLLNYCESLIMLHDMREELETMRQKNKGYSYVSGSGQVKLLPLVTAVDNMSKSIASIAARLRLSPSARLPTRTAATQAITSVDKWKKESDDDAISELFAHPTH